MQGESADESPQVHITDFFRYPEKGYGVQPAAAIFLELGILPIRYETEKRQLLFLKRILSRETCDLLLVTYEQMLRLSFEPN